MIPVLLLKGAGLVKTIRFDQTKYLGDPRNTVRIFNEKEVDELVILDITATREGKEPNYELIREIVSEAFMPVGYGGGITTTEQAEKILGIGVEKVVVNTAAIRNPGFVQELAASCGSQSIVASIDARKTLFGRYEVYIESGRTRTRRAPLEVARELEDRGAGEIFLCSIDRDGAMEGYDLELIRQVAANVAIPLVACGGAGRLDDLARAIREGGASAAAAGSLFVFQGKHRAVLINFPSPTDLNDVLA